jgi:hypothetical protein
LLRRLEVDDGLIETANGGRLIGGPGRLLDASDWRWLWSTRLGAQLEHFGVQAPFEVLPGWLQLAAQLPIPTLTLRVCQYLTWAPFWLRVDRGSRVVRARNVAVPAGYHDGRPSRALLEAAFAQVPSLEVSFDDEASVLPPLAQLGR